MTWWMVLAGAMSVLLVLMVLGFPVFVAFLILNVVGLLTMIGPSGFGMFANSVFTTANIAELAAVPLFILMGELLFRSGAMEVVLDSLDRLIGKIRGRQYVLCILLSAVLGALSGAAMAVAGLLGRSLYPTMRKRGYDEQMSAGTLLGGASLDPIIPPSVLAIIIATLAKVSTGQMLIAGILPGLMLTAMFLVYVFARLRLNPALAPDLSADLLDANTRGSAWGAIARLLPVSAIFFLVVGLVILGVATPTESAATGVVGALVLARYYGSLKLGMILEGLKSAVHIAGMLLIVMCCATMFSQLLTFSGALQQLGEMVMHLDLSPGWMLFVLLAVPFTLFLVLDSVSVLMVLVPIYLPVLAIYGFDPIWFWTLILIVATVGALSPPFGYTLFAFKSAVPEMPMRDIFRAAWPYVWIITFGILLMALFPSIITYLPGLMSRN
ncbi:TRAP transporter large permease [Hydrogenophaga sp. BPS33]|uniref:TRAP transporter large permease n=1 Tax=Hydrogenophaga sp. BPS33 TaxID=2651974 RepID=UPI00131FA198|nr:TRAP transporter large permease [Hydrogenophaga sp. BPS33]QHE83516.1 TRAP transporter large permease [Hydrogenophaga sp. BPS33]